MNIIKKQYKWRGSLVYRDVKKVVDTIVLHHSASGLNLTPDMIHAEHLKLGWTGIGYHFVITPDGKIYEGRPIVAVGSNVEKQNTHIIGICFIGNFDINNQKPTKEQIKSGQDLIKYLNSTIKQFKIKGHRELMATACPGKFFPMELFR